eukprot:c11087_g1_i1.p1 GENE.c11087_g1_i1~~c11087_g1_i1.p1  ORF type:complete len:464 (+),score=102.38 c11087_g1_i1:174-1394(+)
MNDATEAYHEFHSRSLVADKYLKSLPSRPATCEREDEMVAFQSWRDQLEKEGFFDPSPSHVVYRHVELATMFGLGLLCYYLGGVFGIVAGISLHGLFGAFCGWVQHEGGHNSLTGSIKTDKLIQKAAIGFGLCCSGDMWNSMHEKHHATPQKIGYDLDLDTTPLVAFFTTAIEDNRPRGFWRSWSRFQHLTFLPITSGIFVMMFWLLFLHPRQVLRSGDFVQLAFMLSGHVVRPLLIHLVTGYSLLTCYGLLWASLWFSGVYLFGHFSTSHTHLPVVERDAHKNWLRFALEHTVDIDPSNPLVSWAMGYLNCQVIHHLFPNMPQYKQPIVSRKLIEFCKEHGIKYEIIGYFEAWRRTFANLKNVGEHYHTHGIDKKRAAMKHEDVGKTLKLMKAHANLKKQQALGA